MNILVTGGAGYIGSATAEALIKAGHAVTVYDSLVTGHRAAVPKGASFVEADLGDSRALVTEPASRPSCGWPPCSSVVAKRVPGWIAVPGDPGLPGLTAAGVRKLKALAA